MKPIEANSGSQQMLVLPFDSSCCKDFLLFPTRSSLIVFELLQMHATSHP